MMVSRINPIILLNFMLHAFGPEGARAPRRESERVSEQYIEKIVLGAERLLNDMRDRASEVAQENGLSSGGEIALLGFATEQGRKWRTMLLESWGITEEQADRILERHGAY